VTTGQIYWGAVPFVLIQILMVGLIIAFPKLVSSGLGKEATVDVDKAFQQMQMPGKESARDAAPMFGSPPAASATGSPASAPATAPAATDRPAPSSDDEAMKRLLESMQGDAAKKP
jgi:GntP family gluconate:H+ symporter